MSRKKRGFERIVGVSTAICFAQFFKDLFTLSQRFMISNRYLSDGSK